VNLTWRVTVACVLVGLLAAAAVAAVLAVDIAEQWLAERYADRFEVTD